MSMEFELVIQSLWATSGRAFFFFSGRGRVACGILVPRPGMEPVPSALGVQSLNHWTAREVRKSILKLQWYHK